MKRLVGYALLLGLALFALVYNFNRTEEVQNSILRREILSSKRSESKKKFERLVMSARPIEVKPVQPESFQATVEVTSMKKTQCEVFELGLLNLDLSEALGQIFPKLPGDCSQGNPQLYELRENYRIICSEKSFKSDAEKTECIALVSLYRALINDRRIKDEQIEEISDQRTLVDIILASSGAHQNWKRMMAAARRLHRLEPDLYEASKAQVAAAMFGWSSSQTDEEKAEVFSSLERSLAEAQEFQAGDSELAEAAIMLESRMMEDLSRAETKIDELGENGLDPALVQYYRAGISWKKGDKSEALAYLKEAIKLRPEVERFHSTLDKLKEAEIGTKGAFSFSMKMSFLGKN